jgi:hypothetical protein
MKGHALPSPGGDCCALIDRIAASHVPTDADDDVAT